MSGPMKMGTALTVLLAGQLVAQAGVERCEYRGWPDAYRITNGQAELVVVPAIGRIMRYALTGGPNALWEDSRWSGIAERAPKWRNLGGDKIWPWPESLWRRVPYQPPVEWDASQHEVTVTGELSLRMTSPYWEEYGLRVIREITLAEKGARVDITTRLEGRRPEVPTVLWSITQVPAPRGVFVQIEGKTDPPWTNLGRVEIPGIRYGCNDALVLDWPEKISKAGFDSRRIAAWSGDILFVQELMVEKGTDWEAFTQAQIFFKPVAAALGDSHGYAELEFTAPTAQPNLPHPLTVAWDLVRLPSADQEAALRSFHLFFDK